MNIRMPVLLSLLFLALSLVANDKEDVRSIITSKIKLLTKIVRDDKLLDIDKKEKIDEATKDIFDYDIMSKLALGKFWKRASTKDKRKFLDLFSQNLKDSYSSKLLLFKDRNVKVLEAIGLKKNKIKVHTQILGDDIHEIYYFFYKSKNNKWLIYDVSISGVSVIRSFRVQFYDFLASKTFSQLLDKIASK